MVVVLWPPEWFFSPSSTEFPSFLSPNYLYFLFVFLVLSFSAPKVAVFFSQPLNHLIARVVCLSLSIYPMQKGERVAVLILPGILFCYFPVRVVLTPPCAVFRVVTRLSEISPLSITMKFLGPIAIC